MKILICEDELLIAESLRNYCTNLGYEVVGIASSKAKAMELLFSMKPDIVLLDINIEGNKEGIDIALDINLNHRIPFIFITAYSDPITFFEASQTMPSAYIIKPVDELSLKINIELALIKFKNQIFYRQPQKLPKLSKTPKDISEVDFEFCSYINSNENYIHIYFVDNTKCMLRFTISDLEPILDASFVRVHKSYIVNLKYVSTVLGGKLNILGTWIPIGRTYKDNLTRDFLS